MLDEHAVELMLGRRRGLRIVVARDERAGERPFGIARTELGRGRLAEQQPVPALERRIGEAERLAVDLARRLRHADVVPQRLRHSPHAIGAREDRHRQYRLLGYPVRALDVTPEQQVELLIGAAQLDVGANGDGVVALEQRIEELQHRDRGVRGEPLGEVLALDDLSDGRSPRETEQVLHGHREPLAVAAHLDPLAIEHCERLLDIRARVGVDLLRGDDRSRLGAAAGVAHPRRVVTDDQHHGVTEVLELPQLAQNDGMAEVDVGGRRVDAELRAQRTLQPELVLQRPGGEAFDRIPRQPRGRLRGRGRHWIHPAQC
jgi:hypothetical protein